MLRSRWIKMALTVSHHHCVGFDCLDDVPAGTDMTTVVKMLENRIIALEERASMDEVLRAKYPALQELYDEYETMKALIATYE